MPSPATRRCWGTPSSRSSARGARRTPPRRPPRWTTRTSAARARKMLLDPYGSCLFLANFRSFSAVSKRTFASKYAFDSIFQNLPDYQADFFEIWQNFANRATFAKISLNFESIFIKIADFSNRFFAKILRMQRCKSMQIL